MSTRRWREDVAERPASPTCGGYRLDLVARRVIAGSNCSHCLCCGLLSSLWSVSVRSRSDGRLSTITLCEKCLYGDGAAWTLRWVPVPFEFER
jgi:hypothetical protein